VKRYAETLKRAGASARSISARVAAARPKRLTKERWERCLKPDQRRLIARFERELKKAPPTTTERTRRSFSRLLDRYRALLQRTGLSEQGIGGHIGRITRSRRSISRVRQQALGELRLDAARRREDWLILRNMIRDRDDRFEQYLEAAEELGVPEQIAVDFWFSPEAG
jgi:hypothetical protein